MEMSENMYENSGYTADRKPEDRNVYENMHANGHTGTERTRTGNRRESQRSGAHPPLSLFQFVSPASVEILSRFSM